MFIWLSHFAQLTNIINSEVKAITLILCCNWGTKYNTLHLLMMSLCCTYSILLRGFLCAAVAFECVMKAVVYHYSFPSCVPAGLTTVSAPGFLSLLIVCVFLYTHYKHSILQQCSTLMFFCLAWSSKWVRNLLDQSQFLPLLVVAVSDGMMSYCSQVLILSLSWYDFFSIIKKYIQIFIMNDMILHTALQLLYWRVVALSDCCIANIVVVSCVIHWLASVFEFSYKHWQDPRVGVVGSPLGFWASGMLLVFLLYCWKLDMP